MYIYWILMIVILIVAFVITVKIANSNENKHANPDYHKNAGAKLIKLTSYYIIATALGVIVFLLYLFFR